MNPRSISIAGQLLLLFSTCLLAQQLDYTIRPVPPALVQDSDTALLLDLSQTKTATNQVSLNPQGWTMEMILRIPAKSSLTQDCQLIQWGEPDNYGGQVRVWQSGSVGIIVWGRAGKSGRAQSFNFNIHASANNGSAMGGGQWLYFSVGWDCKSGRAAAVLRDMNGEILGQRADSFSILTATAEQRAAWEEFAASLAKLPAPTLSIGNDSIEIGKLRISNRFRDEVLIPIPQLIGRGTIISADQLDPRRAQTRTVTRGLGFDGYNNFAPVPVQEEFIPLSRGDAPILLPLKNLGIGLYSIMLHGTIDAKGRAALERVWRPCPMEFELRDASGHVVEQGRLLLKQGFSPRRMQGFHFHINTPGDYTASFRLTDRAQETAQILYAAFVDQLKDLPNEVVKHAQNLAEGKTGQLTGLTDERKKRDDSIWESLPPLNVHMEVQGQLKDFLQPPASVKLPAWETAAYGAWTNHGFVSMDYWKRSAHSIAPLDFINTQTGEIFPQDKIVRGEPWPGDWSDDGTGVFFTKRQFPELAHDIYYAPRAVLLSERVKLFLGLLGAGNYKDYNNLPKKYFETGDPSIGHDAAMALVRFAYDWPAVEMSLHEIRLCTHSPDFEYNVDWTAGRNGKYYYEGWTGPMTVDVMESYDKLFPYIQNNQVFADAVHRFIPWVKTPTDVVRYLDRWLVFASVRDFRRGLMRAAPLEDVAARVLGPGPLTAEFYDLTKQEVEIYPYQGTYQELYATALSRSGCYYVGSFMVYDFGDAANTVNKAYLILQAKKLGVKLPMDLSDGQHYPKVRSAANFLIDMWPAGGFPFMAGDASGGTHTGLIAKQRIPPEADAIRHAFELFGDPRHAWILQNLLGQTNAAIARAAATVRDPLLHEPSRVVSDWGAIIEAGVDETNLLKKTAVTLRLGIGQGHAHADYLDLNLFAMGLPMAVDLACRNEGSFWSRPGAGWAFLHNHAIAHPGEDPNGAGGQTGEPWLRAFAPPLVRASYVNPKGDVRLDRDVIIVQIDDTDTYYAFDVQRLRGDKMHTWCFHGCESDDVKLNVPMESKTVRWIDRLLEGTHKVGQATDTLQATWTMTREGREVKHNFMGGGVIKTVACEPAVLGNLYDSNLPPVHVRATLLGHAGDKVLQGNPYSQVYNYSFPFLWVQKQVGASESVYPAIYEWYRGDTPVVAKAALLSEEPLTVCVTTTSGQVDTFTATSTGFSFVSRDKLGIRFAQLNGGDSLMGDGISINATRASYRTEITDIDYLKRTIRVRDPLPPNPRVSVGNDGHRTYLELKGSGTSFTYEGDLLIQQGAITQIKVTDDDHLSVESDMKLYGADSGNRKLAGFTIVNEDLSWQFRGGKVIKRPAGAKLTDKVFTDANGDGRVHMKTYEIGVGDAVELLTDVTIRRVGKKYELVTNTDVRAKVDGKSGEFVPSEKPQVLRGWLKLW